MKNSSASLFLQKKMKCLLFFSGKQLRASLFLQKKNKAPHYFFRKNGAPPYFFRKKIKHQIISSEKNVFLTKKRHLIFILKRSWGALFFSEEILRHLIFVCEELMRRLIFFWRRDEALGLVASIFLLMLFLQWQNQVPQYFFRKKSSASSFLQKKC